MMIVVIDANGVKQTIPTGAEIIAALGTPAQTADVQALRTTLGSPLQAGGTVPTDTVVRAVAVDRGGTITAGGTAQQLMAANAARRGYSVQNQSTGDLYINALAAATIDYHSLKIPAGSLYETPSNHVGPGAVSIIGATTGAAWYSREF